MEGSGKYVRIARCGCGCVDGVRRMVAQAPAVATIGKIIEPLDATPASAVKSTGIFILDRNLGAGLPSGSVVYLS